MEQDQRSVRLSTSMPKLGTEKMAALSNATHRKTKAKPGSRILLRKRFISDEKLPTFTEIYHLSVLTRSYDSLFLIYPCAGSNNES